MGAQGPALLARFGLIPRSTAARVACDASVRLVVKHGERVLNVGRARRVVSPRQRAALAEQYQTCVVPGCAIRFADCDIHHLWWWSPAGPTDHDLQVPLCGAHHLWLHEGDYTITCEDTTPAGLMSLTACGRWAPPLRRRFPVTARRFPRIWGGADCGPRTRPGSPRG